VKPLCIDLYCGLGGWAEGFLSEGYRVIGFDIARLPYPGELVIGDVLSISGAEIVKRYGVPRVIVASPPCQEPSYRNMPWGRLKLKRGELGPPENFIRFFYSCYRLRREIEDASGEDVPLIIENVRGAQDWIGRASANYGSYFLWGDVPRDLPKAQHPKVCRNHRNKRNGHRSTFHLTNPHEHGIKQSGIGGLRKNGKGDGWFQDGAARFGSKSKSRKVASALIAKIPFPLAQHIARVYYPRETLQIQCAAELSQAPASS
jgi:hypothetical protein